MTSVVQLNELETQQAKEFQEKQLKEQPDNKFTKAFKPLIWSDIVVDELDKKHIGDRSAKEVIFLCALGRLVKNKRPYSFNVIALSSSSAGKDHLMSSVLKLFPKETYETYSRISRTSLNYIHTLDKQPDWTYDGRMLLLKEISDEVLNNEIMKEFTSGEEEISKVLITKQGGAGADVIEVRGHPCVFVTTATTIPSEEIRNRFSIIKLDESEEQTRATRRAYKQNNYATEVIDKLKGLKSMEVEIPQDIINFVDKNFPINKVRYRRDYPKFLDWIKAVAIFHQHKSENATGVIFARWEDYNIARDVFMNTYTSLADIPLKDIDKKIISFLEQTQQPQTVKDIYNYLSGRCNLTNTYKHVDSLKNTGILETFELKDVFSNHATKYDLSEEYKDKKPMKLPIYTGDVDE